MTDEGRIALTVLEIAAMAFWSVLMLDLIEESYQEYELSTNELEAAMHQQIQMAQTMHAHTLGVTHVFLQQAMQESFAYPVDEVEYSSICNASGDLIGNTYPKAVTAERFYHNAFCMPRRMSGQQGHASGIATVDFAFARSRAQERRKERQTEARIKTIQRAHTGTFRNPQAAFGLMENAVQLYSGLQSGALQTLGGNLGTFGATISQFANRIADISEGSNTSTSSSASTPGTSGRV